MLGAWTKMNAKSMLPTEFRKWLRAKKQHLTLWPPVGWGRFRSSNRLQPVSRLFGFDRGQCIDRYYIESFLTAHREDIQGHVLEIGDDVYTCKFGGDRVTKKDVLHLVASNPRATIVADLTCAKHIPSDVFDCIIFTQTLPFIYDVRAAIQTLYRILKPRGVLLATFPGISQISRYDMVRWGDYWRFTDASAQRLFADAFGSKNIQVRIHGNVLVACAFLHGLAAQELRPHELEYQDPDYQLLLTLKAVKAG
jgi:hypothetical protein